MSKEIIEAGKAVLGIELGSTRIKAVLINEENRPIASGSHAWENRLEHGLWTYSEEDIRQGLQACYQDLRRDVREKYDTELVHLKALGISAMMHGYMAFDKKGRLLIPFRTWRNTNTGKAAEALTELFQYNIPLRWSISHLYQCILDGEEHVGNLDYLTTLSGYVHWILTGEKVLGVGDASGMFPVDAETGDYRQDMTEKFDALIREYHYPWKLREILPRVLRAGEKAGVLTEEGARLLDGSGTLQPGVPLCPPEGDAGTGMVATNSVAPRTGNVSAGTSVFAMVVLEKPLKKLHTEIDLVTTPDGAPVAMAHANNCTSDLNAWVQLFGEFAECMGRKIDTGELYRLLYEKALEGEPDCGELLSYGYFSGENMIPLTEGRPLFVRMPDSRFNLANFMRAHLYGALSALKIGMDILNKEEHVQIDQIYGHGGLFKTPVVGQRFMAAAMNSPISVLETAGEGGAWGVALLAAYMSCGKEGESLEQFLEDRVFKGSQGTRIEPVKEDLEGFEKYIERFRKGLEVEQKAVERLRS
jgi:sugar (pentulose or hexulose) kinase